MAAHVSPSEIKQAADAINGIFAPALMINGTALIVLALQAKYSQLIDRLRALNDERRDLVGTEDQPSYVQRHKNVIDQIEVILLRARLVRNSVSSLYAAIMMFILASITIGVPVVAGSNKIPANSSLAMFVVGVILVFIGVGYALRDITSAYKVARIEVRGIKGVRS